MKKSSFLILSLFLLVISCINNNDYPLPEENTASRVLTCYEKYKKTTLLHNEILNDFYQYAKSKKIKYSKPISNEDLDEQLNIFISSINREKLTTTRANNKVNLEYIKVILNKNNSTSSKKYKTRNINEDEDEDVNQFQYLNYFCEELFAIDTEGLSAELMDNEIKFIINNTYEEYTWMDNSDIENLAFVASVAYNSYAYWYDEAGNWYNELVENGDEPSEFEYIPSTRRVRFWDDLWSAVKSGTKKWYKADTMGATRAIATVSIFGGALDAEAALIGAAAASWEGAIENFFIDDVDVDEEDNGDDTNIDNNKDNEGNVNNENEEDNGDEEDNGVF